MLSMNKPSCIATNNCRLTQEINFVMEERQLYITKDVWVNENILVVL